MTDKLGYPFQYGDELTVEEAKQNLIDAISVVQTNGKFFVAGATVGLTFKPNLASAADEAKRQVGQQANKQLARRASNAATCGAIAAVCNSKVGQKAAQKAAEKGAEIASSNPIASTTFFVCGFCVAWCAKYVAFDR